MNYHSNKQFGNFIEMCNSQIFAPTIVNADKTRKYDMKLLVFSVSKKHAKNFMTFRENIHKKNLESDLLGEPRKKSDYLGSRNPKKIENYLVEPHNCISITPLPDSA